MEKRLCSVIDLGLCSFDKAYALQQAVLEAKIDGSSEDTLILVEHFPIITLGRRGRIEHVCASAERLQAEGIEVRNIDRGGDVTYHGPGQLVGYPIIDLRAHKQDVDWVLRQLETVVIRSLKRLNIDACAVHGMTGVWVGGAKIAAIGIGIRHWVTFHGFALNVDPPMKHFELIIPCGLKNKPVTCVRDVLASAPDIPAIKQIVIESFCETFELERASA
ncbi:MAG: lipoyl(octanoyl) transferase LipB [Candidatus Lindowbacteria bacterium]|nr:lipoyl(octanoyl) transferase LipB [Candidatus Lindowbacteria bacterium]